MADGPTQHTPIDLRDVLIDGATLAGDPVLWIACKLKSGKEFKMKLATSELPQQEQPEMVQGESPELTDKQRAVLQVIEQKMKVGDALSVEKIAQLAGYANSSDLRNFIKILQLAGRLRGTTHGQIRIC